MKINMFNSVIFSDSLILEQPFECNIQQACTYNKQWLLLNQTKKTIHNWTVDIILMQFNMYDLVEKYGKKKLLHTYFLKKTPWKWVISVLHVLNTEE